MKKKIILIFFVLFVGVLSIISQLNGNVKKVSAKEQLRVGIDLSYHQGEINWHQVKDTGIDFVMLRIGYDYVMDKKFESYLKGAKEIGVDIGVYFYSYADSVEDAINEAENCVKWLNKYPATFTYPIVYDAEENKMAKFAAKACEAFCKVLLDNGYYPMIYASTSWFNGVIAPLSTVSHIEFWQANYYSSYANKTPGELKDVYSKRPKLNSFDENVKMWQCTDSGFVKGITGGVDVNISYVDYSKIITSNGYNGFVKNEQPLPEINGDVSEDNDKNDMQNSSNLLDSTQDGVTNGEQSESENDQNKKDISGCSSLLTGNFATFLIVGIATALIKRKR